MIKAFTLMPLFWGIIALLTVIGLAFMVGMLKGKSLAKSAVIGSIAFVFIGGALGLYHHWGANSLLLEQASLQQVSTTLNNLGQQPDLTQEQILATLQTLAENIADSSAANAQLGLLYIELGQYTQATQVLTKAVTLAPDHDEYWVQWIYSHSLLHQGKLPHEVKQKALTLMHKEDTQKPIYNLLAIDDYFQGDYQKACDKWQFILETDDTLTPERRLVLENAIKSAKQHLPSAPKIVLESQLNAMQNRNLK